MGKRVNPHRRMLAYQMALRRDLVKHGNSDDVGKLQQGRVRSQLRSIESKAFPKEHWKPEEELVSKKTGILFVPQYEYGSGRKVRSNSPRYRPDNAKLSLMKERLETGLSDPLSPIAPKE